MNNLSGSIKNSRGVSNRELKLRIAPVKAIQVKREMLLSEGADGKCHKYVVAIKTGRLYMGETRERKGYLKASPLNLVLRRLLSVSALENVSAFSHAARDCSVLPSLCSRSPRCYCIVADAGMRRTASFI